MKATGHQRRPSKIHLLAANRENAEARHYMAIGHGGWTYGRFMVRAHVFPFLPKSAQCDRCRQRIIETPGTARDRHGMTIRQFSATDEQITAVECGLIGMSRVWPA